LKSKINEFKEKELKEESCSIITALTTSLTVDSYRREEGGAITELVCIRV
jgi:hypothetical protein